MVLSMLTNMARTRKRSPSFVIYVGAMKKDDENTIFYTFVQFLVRFVYLLDLHYLICVPNRSTFVNGTLTLHTSSVA